MLNKENRDLEQWEFDFGCKPMEIRVLDTRLLSGTLHITPNNVLNVLTWWAEQTSAGAAGS
jgi:hypothetical protein